MLAVVAGRLTVTRQSSRCKASRRNVTLGQSGCLIGGRDISDQRCTLGERDPKKQDRRRGDDGEHTAA